MFLAMLQIFQDANIVKSFRFGNFVGGVNKTHVYYD